MPPEETGFVTGRKALITTLVSLALSPFAIVTGYYLSKVLAAPRLKVQYARPDIEREPLIVSEPTIAAIRNDSVTRSQISSGLLFQCDRSMLSDGKVTKPCLKAALNIVAQAISTRDTELKAADDNIKSIDAWSGSGELVLTPLPGAAGDLAQLNTIARRSKVEGLEVLKGFVKATQARRSALETFLNELRTLDQRPEPQPSGTVRLFVGVLNVGDADGVIFPDGNLQFDDVTLPLLSRRAETDKTGQYTVVKAHAFQEIPFDINEGESKETSLARWKALVKKESEVKFTVMIRSPKDLAGAGRLPQ